MPNAGVLVANSFYERPVLNSPYRPPALHHPLDKTGQPLGGEPKVGRRPSRFIVPVPASRKKAAAGQTALDLETYTENALINEVRGYLEPWRALRNPADWGVTAVSQRLLEHWRRPEECVGWPAPLLLPTRSCRDDHLADRGRTEASGVEGTPGSDPESQRGSQPGAVPPRAENGHGQREDDRHGHADRLAGGQCGAPGLEGLLPRLPDRHARHHDPRPAARAAAERARQLLRDARDGAAGHAAGDPPRRDRHHQLPRLPAPRRWACPRWRAAISRATRRSRSSPSKPMPRC